MRRGSAGSSTRSTSRRTACSGRRSAGKDRLPALEVEEVDPCEVDGEIDALARLGTRPWVKPRRERACELDGTLADLDDVEPGDAEVRVGLRPELLGHLDLGRQDREAVLAGELRVGELLRPEADQHLLRRGIQSRPHLVGEREPVRPERNAVWVEPAADEVHRRAADEAREEWVFRGVVEALAWVD